MLRSKDLALKGTIPACGATETEMAGPTIMVRVRSRAMTAYGLNNLRQFEWHSVEQERSLAKGDTDHGQVEIL